MRLPESVVGVCFDIGGTLVRMPRGALSQEIAALLDADVTLVRELLVQHGKRRPTTPGALAAAIAVGCGRPSAVDPIRAALERRRREVADPVLYDDAIPALEMLRCRGLRMFYLSNAVGYGDLRSTPAFFGYAEVVLHSWQTGYCKPEMGAFHALEASCGLAATQLVCVGNSLAADVDGARAAGWSAIYLPRDTPDPAEVAGVVSITSLTDMADLLPPRHGRTPASGRSAGRR